MSSFNSIKVRLERIPETSEKVDAHFQFHKGTIRTVVPHAKKLPEALSIP